MRFYHLIAPVTLLALACSSTNETAPPADDEPVWTDAPANVSLGEGQTVEVALDVSDPDGGDVVVSISQATGVDVEVAGDTLRVHAGYGSAVGDFEVTLTDDEGTAALVKVAVAITPYRWLEHQEWQTADGPEEREHASVFYDAGSGSAFLFGGSGYHPQFTQLLDDFWRYDTADGSWTAITPSGDVPAGAGSRRFAGAWGAGEGLVFGGYAGLGNLAELYRVKVEGGTLAFEELTSSSVTPTGRALHAFVYDPQTSRYYLFGGVTSSPLGDTWQLEIDGNDANWTKLELANGPSARYGTFYGFDEEVGRLIVYSGAQGTGQVDPARDTWALDVRSEPPVWMLLSEGETVPPGRRNGCGVWDPTGQRLIVFGGTPDAMVSAPGLFAFDARPGHEGWATLERAGEPPLRSSGFGFSSDNRVFLGFGNGASGVHRDWGILGY